MIAAQTDETEGKEMKKSAKLGTESVLGLQCPAKWESLSPSSIQQDPRRSLEKNSIPQRRQSFQTKRGISQMMPENWECSPLHTHTHTFCCHLRCPSQEFAQYQRTKAQGCLRLHSSPIGWLLREGTSGLKIHP